MRPDITASTVVAGVAGAPIGHSLSPSIHNAWIRAAGLDAVYVAFAPGPQRFAAFCEGLRGGVIRGLNVTAPFKQDALALADVASARATAAGSANLLIFEAEGAILADSTDGEGLLAAFAGQAPGFDPGAAETVILGAGGAARAAAAAFSNAASPVVWLANRSFSRAAEVARAIGGPVRALAMADLPAVLANAGALVNATPAGPGGSAWDSVDLAGLPGGAVVMDMTYRPLRTPLLARAEARGLRTVDGLAMLIGQARPSFHAFFGRQPPEIDVRALAKAA
jgi:shikimate dehydrogenase